MLQDTSVTCGRQWRRQADAAKRPRRGCLSHRDGRRRLSTQSTAALGRARGRVGPVLRVCRAGAQKVRLSIVIIILATAPLAINAQRQSRRQPTQHHPAVHIFRRSTLTSTAATAPAASSSGGGREWRERVALRVSSERHEDVRLAGRSRFRVDSQVRRGQVSARDVHRRCHAKSARRSLHIISRPKFFFVVCFFVQ